MNRSGLDTTSRAGPAGQPGCQSSVDQILELIKDPLSVYAEEFPNIVVGDTEPTDIAEQNHWKDDVSAWVSIQRELGGQVIGEFEG